MYGQEKSAQTTSHTNSPSELKQPTPKAQPALPTSVNVVDQQAANKKENKIKDHPESYLSRLFSPENLPNVGLFIAGVVGIIVAIRTLKAIRRQGLSMRRQTTHLRNSVAQAKKAADAARRSADAYEKATRLTERADVLLESAGIILSATTGVFDGHARVVLRFKNFGRTRARDVSFRVRLIIPEVPDANIRELPHMVLGADQGQSVSFEPFIWMERFIAFRQVAMGSGTRLFRTRSKSSLTNICDIRKPNLGLQMVQPAPQIHEANCNAPQ